MSLLSNLNGIELYNAESCEGSTPSQLNLTDIEWNDVGKLRGLDAL